MTKLNLVTGANGHLGNNLVRALLDNGEQVRASVRNTKNTVPFEGLDCEIVYADLMDKVPCSVRWRGCIPSIRWLPCSSIGHPTLRRILSSRIFRARKIFLKRRQARVWSASFMSAPRSRWMMKSCPLPNPLGGRSSTIILMCSRKRNRSNWLGSLPKSLI